MAARSSLGGFVVATVNNPGSFMASITHPTGNGYCRGIGYCVTVHPEFKLEGGTTAIKGTLESLLFHTMKPECTCMIESSSENARTVQGHCKVKILLN